MAALETPVTAIQAMMTEQFGEGQMPVLVETNDKIDYLIRLMRSVFAKFGERNQDITDRMGIQKQSFEELIGGL